MPVCWWRRLAWNDPVMEPRIQYTKTADGVRCRSKGSMSRYGCSG
jgi:hypothetical protein